MRHETIDTLLFTMAVFLLVIGVAAIERMIKHHPHRTVVCLNGLSDAMPLFFFDLGKA